MIGFCFDQFINASALPCFGFSVLLSYFYCPVFVVLFRSLGFCYLVLSSCFSYLFCSHPALLFPGIPPIVPPHLFPKRTFSRVRVPILHDKPLFFPRLSHSFQHLAQSGNICCTFPIIVSSVRIHNSCCPACFSLSEDKQPLSYIPKNHCFYVQMIPKKLAAALPFSFRISCRLTAPEDNSGRMYQIHINLPFPNRCLFWHRPHFHTSLRMNICIHFRLCHRIYVNQHRSIRP